MSQVTKITYRFQDSSKPPRFHRSYTIAVTPQSAGMSVDCYEKILSEKTYELDKDRFDQLVKKMNECRINYKHTKDANDQCKGGTSEIIECFSVEGVVFSAHVYHCGGKSTGTLAGDTEAFSKEVKMLIPDFHSLLAS